MSTIAPAEAPELAALFDKRPQVIKPGLDRMEAALQVLAREELLGTPTALIGGTNGKGTTSGFLWQLTAALGWRVGLFTSPHLQHYAERLQLSHQRVDNQTLVAELAKLKEALPPPIYEALSFFEVNTLLALSLFRRAGADLNLLEVGLGGRWDATNVARPCLSIITSIGLDHQQWLGSTTAAIAQEKAGIMRASVPVIWGGPGAGDDAAAATLRSAAAGLKAPFWEQGQAFCAEADAVYVNLPFPGCEAIVQPWPAPAAEWPPFLRDNFAKACAALVWLLHAPATAPLRQRLQLTPTEAVARAVAAISNGTVRRPPCMRARFEQVSVPTHAHGPRPLLLDVCHNTAGAHALVAGLHSKELLTNGRKLTALVSILVDKDCDDILDILRTALAPISLFAVASERSWTPARLAERHRDLPFYPHFSAAWSASPHAFTVICGSVHAVGEAMTTLGL